MSDRNKPIVWVIMHYEFMGHPDSPWIDSVQFHVSSSRRKAESYVRNRGVVAHSWWQVHPHVLDAQGDDAEGEEVSFYSHRGTPLKSAPIERARAAFQKHVLRYPEEHWPPSRES